MVAPAELQEVGHRDQDARTNAARVELLLADEVVQRPATDGEHLRGLGTTDKQPLFRGDRGAAWRLPLGDVGPLAFGEVYFFHGLPPLGAYGIVSPDKPDCLHPSMGLPVESVQYFLTMARQAAPMVERQLNLADVVEIASKSEDRIRAGD